MREVDRLRYAYLRGAKHLTRLEALRGSYRGKRTLDDLAATKLAARIENDDNVRRVIANFAGDPLDAYNEVWVCGPSVLREILTNPASRDQDKISALQLAGKATGHLDENVNVRVDHVLPYERLIRLPGEEPLDAVNLLPERTNAETRNEEPTPAEKVHVGKILGEGGQG